MHYNWKSKIDLLCISHPLFSVSTTFFSWYVIGLLLEAVKLRYLLLYGMENLKKIGKLLESPCSLEATHIFKSQQEGIMGFKIQKKGFD